MIPKEQIAHDLTLVYLNNKYGVDVTGHFSVSSSSFDDSIDAVDGSGNVNTVHLPDIEAVKYIKVGTGEKGFFGNEKKKKVQSGYLVDDIFSQMIEDYYKAYKRFFEMVEKR